MWNDDGGKPSARPSLPVKDERGLEAGGWTSPASKTNPMPWMPSGT